MLATLTPPTPTSAAAPAAPALSAAAFDSIAALVRRRTAIVLEPEKRYLVESRLAPVAKKNGFASIEKLAEELKRAGSDRLQQIVLDAMTTNETSFFRDLHPFEALKKTIVPELMRRRATQQTLNIWSNACSSGQEIYTIGMTLRENFPSLANWKVEMLATDFSDEMLAKAKQGTFNQTEMNRGLPATLLVKYFSRQGMTWQIKPELRDQVNFRKLNLIEPWGALPRFDVIFLRNVLIYFAPETKKQILAKIRACLAPDGYMFLGGAETTTGLDDQFERTMIDGSVCYRLKNRS